MGVRPACTKQEAVLLDVGRILAETHEAAAAELPSRFFRIKRGKAFVHASAYKGNA
jgi:hypothetical protein